MGTMGSVVLSGYFGFDNVGDEAVLYAIVHSLKDEIKDIDITVLSNSPEKTAKRYHVKAVNRWRYKQIVSVLKNTDLLISGGGSLLQDVTSWRSVVYYLSIVLIAKLFRKKVVFYAQGIGPVSRKFNRLLIKWIVNKVDYLSVRDAESKNELIKMGIKNKLIEIEVDPVLRLKFNNKENRNQKRVGVYLRKWDVDDLFFNKIQVILNWFSNQGWDIIFIPMHYPEDLDVAKEISQKVSGSTVYEGEHFPKDILHLTGTLNYVIGMRLHALIMAAAVEVPFLGLSYDPKVKNFVHTMKVGKSVEINSINLDEIIPYLEKTINNLDKIKERLIYRKNELIHFKSKPLGFIKEFIS